MARTPEGRVKDACKTLLDTHGAYYYFTFSGGYTRAGIPDIVACVNGKFLGIECKAGKGKTTLLQERELAAICKANGVAIVVREDTIDELERVLWMLKTS